MTAVIMNLLRAVLVLLVLASPVRTQEVPSAATVVPGAVVRVAASGLGPESRIGTVLSLSSTALEVSLRGFGGATPLSIQLSAIQEIEVEIGKTRAGGALIGGSIGLLAIGGSRLLACSGECFVEGKEKNAIEVVAGALIGAIGGALVGSRVLARSRWAVVTLGGT